MAVALLCVLCGETLFGQPQASAERTRYDIQLSLDFEKRTYTGTERVRWINRGNRPTTTLFFHLYSNVRVPRYALLKKFGDNDEVADEPRLEILEVKAAATNNVVPFSVDDQETLLRVNLREPVAPNAATEILIMFRGHVPEIDPEETGLVAHVMQQVSAAIGGARELRRARDINFRCRGVMLLGTAYPVLAARNGDGWFRRIEPSISDTLVADTADYQVTVDAPRDITVYASAPRPAARPRGC